MLEAMHASSVCAPAFLRQFFNVDMHLRRDRRAINEQFAARVHQQIVAASAENLPHRVVIGHDSEDHVRFCRHFRQILARRRSQAPRQARSGCAIRIVNSRDVKLSIFQSARHVRAHATHSNKTDIHSY